MGIAGWGVDFPRPHWPHARAPTARGDVPYACPGTQSGPGQKWNPRYDKRQILKLNGSCDNINKLSYQTPSDGRVVCEAYDQIWHYAILRSTNFLKLPYNKTAKKKRMLWKLPRGPDASIFLPANEILQQRMMPFSGSLPGGSRPTTQKAQTANQGPGILFLDP